jgi:hypothetical protein
MSEIRIGFGPKPADRDRARVQKISQQFIWKGVNTGFSGTGEVIPSSSATAASHSASAGLP